MSTLYIMVGAPGSGKTVFASKLAEARSIDHISSDAIRLEMTGDEMDQTMNPQIFAEMHRRVKNLLDDGKDVIADATNTYRWARDKFVNLALPDHRVVFLVMSTSFEECVKRNGLRDRCVPEHAIERMYYSASIPTQDQGGLVVFIKDSTKIENIP